MKPLNFTRRIVTSATGRRRLQTIRNIIDTYLNNNQKKQNPMDSNEKENKRESLLKDLSINDAIARYGELK
jgi:hypothetical protein